MKGRIRVSVLLGISGLLFFAAGSSVSNTTILADTQHSVMAEDQDGLKAPDLKSISWESDGSYILS